MSSSSLTVRYEKRERRQRGRGFSNDPRYNTVRQVCRELEVNGLTAVIHGFESRKQATNAAGVAYSFGQKMGKTRGWVISTWTEEEEDGTGTLFLSKVGLDL